MNWGEIKTAVKGYLETNETTFVSNLQLYARLAEAEIYRQVQLQWTKQLALSTLIPEDRYLTIPNGCLSIYSLSYVNAMGETVYLLAKDLSFLKEAFPVTSAYAPPRYYAYRDEQVLALAPIPDQIYDVEMHYYRYPESIGDNNDDSKTNWLSKYGENALIFGILEQGYIYQKGDQDVIAKYTEHSQKAIADLKLIAEGRQNKDTYRQPDTRVPT